MKKCKQCQMENNDEAVFCEHCGQPFNTTNYSDIDTTKQDVNASLENGKINNNNLNMKNTIQYCEECGTENLIDAKFCEHCGHLLSTNSNADSITESNRNKVADKSVVMEENNNNRRTEISEDEAKNYSKLENSKMDVFPNQKLYTVSRLNKPTNKLKQVSFVLLIIIAFGSFLGYQYGKSQFTREKQIDKFADNLVEKNAEGLTHQIISEDNHLKINKATVQPLIAYFEKNKKELPKMKQALKINDNYYSIQVVKEGRQYVLFDHYVFKVTPVYGKVKTNHQNTIIKMNNQNIGNSTTKKYKQDIGPYIPGLYTFIATSKTDIDGKMSLKEEVDCVKETEPKINLEFQLVTIPIESNVDNASILVDKKEKGTLTAGKGQVGPLLWHKGMTIQLVQKLDSGELKSDSYKVPTGEFTEVDVEPINLDFEVVDLNEVETGLNQFYNEFSEVVNDYTTYNYVKFADQYYENGKENKDFSDINDYIQWCRQRSKANEYSGVYFETEVSNVRPAGKNQYKIDYNVMYNTSYPASTNKNVRVEGFDYKDVLIVFKANSSTKMKFINMGDGGVKTYDNHANE